MATLILHIGYPKTGTAYLQHTLRQNRDAFRQAGLDYLDAGADLAHKLKFRAAEDSRQDWQGIVERAAASDCTYCMISSEVFTMLSREQVRALHDFIRTIEVRIVVWLRPQAEAIQSGYLQALREGYGLPEFSVYLERQIALGEWHYHQRLQDWEVFGRHRIIVRPYDRSAFPDGDIVQDFCRLFQLDARWESPAATHASNLTIGPKCYAALKQLTGEQGGYQRPSRDVLDQLGLRHSRAFAQLNRVFEELGWKAGRMNLLTAAHLERCEVAFAEQNANVARDYLPRSNACSGDALFSTMPSLPLRSAEPELSASDWVQILAGFLRQTDRTSAGNGNSLVGDEPKIDHASLSFGTTHMSPTVFHITNYKTGSQWVYAVLMKAAPERIVKPLPEAAHVTGAPIQRGMIYPTVYLPRPRFDALDIPGDRRSFVVTRDLRDILVSWYFSMRYSHPDTLDSISTMRQMLAGLDQQQGMRRLLGASFKDHSGIFGSWVDTDVLTVRYEDLLADELACFERIIEHCEIDVSRKRLRQIVDSVSFERLTGGRGRGQEDKLSHQRKGIAGDWRNYFDDDLKQRFKQLYGDLLIAAGYEQDYDW